MITQDQTSFSLQSDLHLHPLLSFIVLEDQILLFFSSDRYKTEICSCYASLYGTPKLEIDYIHGHNSIAFNMTISNLPDFIALLNVTICRDGVEVWYEDKFVSTKCVVVDSS